MIRNAFNGGELSPQLQMRADLEVFARGCLCVENYDIGQSGGVSRRRGFRFVGEAMGTNSRLFVYDAGNGAQYLVEINTEKLRVWSTIGYVEWEANVTLSSLALEQLRTLQINSILLLLSNFNAPLQLVRNSSGEWSLDLYAFKVSPWRHAEYRDFPVKVKQDGEYYAVEFSPDEDARETVYEDGDVLRVSYYTEAVEIKKKAAELLGEIGRKEYEGFLKAGVSVARGVILAVRRAPESAVYSCIKDFNGEDDFVNGLIDPVNYYANFQLSSEVSGVDMAVSELSAKTKVTRGQKLRFDAGYWDIFTCTRAFSWTNDGQSGKVNPEDYPGHFARGMILGSAPCKGKWMFYCSGTWHGSYEVRASYDGDGSAMDDWEYRAEAWSQNASPSNAPVGGDESSEECYVSLWLTRARQYGEELTEKCFPADICGNTLVVKSYKHDIVLQAQSMRDDTGRVVESHIVRKERIRTEFSGSIESMDWSWSAFSGRYGYPRLACIYNQRLVFAGTIDQPMTVWMSQTDDIDNFDIIEADNGAMALTLSGETMDPIRWMDAQNERVVLGTSRGEYVIQSTSGGAMTYANARVTRHGFNGAADVAHLQCEDKIIYVGRGAGRVKQYGYDYSQDAYMSQDLTVYAEHILQDGGGVKDGCVLTQPSAKAVFVLNNGQMALMTYNSMHQVNAWHRYVTDGEFLSVASMLQSDAGDSLYAVVKREVKLRESEPPKEVVYIEVLDDRCGYVDGQREWDYTSTLLTNALTSTQKGGAKKTPDALMIYLLHETSAEGLEVTVDGGRTWARSGVAPSLTIPKGWSAFDGFTTPDYDVAVGFRVCGNHGFDVLALQG